jgi:hypothetical protein
MKDYPKLKAVRDNVNSTEVTIDTNDILGTGSFRITFRGKYENGRRVDQSAACKRFHSYFESLYAIEFYSYDFKVVDQAIVFAQQWNNFCQSKDSITFNRGALTTLDGIQYLFEPIIQPYYKYTSNNGWILKDPSKRKVIECIEAFCHFTYHSSDRNMIVCDLQGVYKLNRFTFTRSHYRLTDPAICSSRRLYGPTDMGQKGISSFFANHTCNQFCEKYGKGKWKRPRTATCYFASATSSAVGHTSMMSSSDAHLLSTKNNARFDINLHPIYE